MQIPSGHFAVAWKGINNEGWLIIKCKALYFPWLLPINLLPHTCARKQPWSRWLISLVKGECQRNNTHSISRGTVLWKTPSLQSWRILWAEVRPGHFRPAFVKLVPFNCFKRNYPTVWHDNIPLQELEGHFSLEVFKKRVDGHLSGLLLEQDSCVEQVRLSDFQSPFPLYNPLVLWICAIKRAKKQFLSRKFSSILINAEIQLSLSWGEVKLDHS